MNAMATNYIVAPLAPAGTGSALRLWALSAHS